MAILSKDQLTVVNEMFDLDLDYSNASHYRAGSIIYKLWKEPDFAQEFTSQDQAADAADDTQSSDQDHEDIS
ncbi:hypothetical protein [Belliella pelovolcani]|uniref:hypothetical protein n=1 Tax=Belliella pelovolcani TaxID=529505 RepID=UPI00391BED58